MAHPYFERPTPLILGHRGAAGVAPENTLPAFRRGLADGAHMLESDIHVTRDGVPVLIHDPEVDRTTGGHGAVIDFDFAELRDLDAGWAFESAAEGGFPFRGQGIRIPSLREAFEAFPESAFNLEIKAPEPNLVPDVLKLVREFEREERTLLVAGDDGIQARLRAEMARSGTAPALGASLSDIVEIVRAASEGRPHASDSMAIQVPLDFAGNRLVTPMLIDHCHGRDVQVHVWTINEADTMRELLAVGVDGIVTDLPGVMAQVIAGPS
ncbi:MAG: glycerophosphodiester phosphodiesterase [Myxococcota bacterium]|nr:glycerophosphodiester phosphodiesterase [Myxococcota bacterium]